MGLISAIALAAAPGYGYAAEHPRTDGGNTFYPAAVWYSGGRARAPMLDRVDGQNVQFAMQQKKVLLKKTFAPHEVWVMDLKSRE